MGRRNAFRDYGWAEAERELPEEAHPEVFAARLGENIEYLLEVADERGWPITWAHAPQADDIIDAFAKANLQ